MTKRSSTLETIFIISIIWLFFTIGVLLYYEEFTKTSAINEYLNEYEKGNHPKHANLHDDKVKVESNEPMADRGRRSNIDSDSDIHKRHEMPNKDLENSNHKDIQRNLKDNSLKFDNDEKEDNELLDTHRLKDVYDDENNIQEQNNVIEESLPNKDSFNIPNNKNTEKQKDPYFVERLRETHTQAWNDGKEYGLSNYYHNEDNFIDLDAIEPLAPTDAPGIHSFFSHLIASNFRITTCV